MVLFSTYRRAHPPSVVSRRVRVLVVRRRRDPTHRRRRRAIRSSRVPPSRFARRRVVVVVSTIQFYATLAHLALHARAAGLGTLVNWEAGYSVDAPRSLAWQSITGFENAGEARFEPLGPARCRVSVVMRYSFPRGLRGLERSLRVRNFMSMTMRGAMERFRERLEEEEEGG